MLQALGVIAGILVVFSYIPYIKDILAKRVEPERASWLIWSVLITIAFFAQMSKGATRSLWFNGLDGGGAIITLGLAIKYGIGGLTRRDILGLFFAGIGLVLWYYTHNAIWVLLISVATDTIGVSLTVMKTLENPSSETYPMWLIVSLAVILAMISVGRLNYTILGYLFYIFLSNFVIAVAIFWGHRTRGRVQVEAG